MIKKVGSELGIREEPVNCCRFAQGPDTWAIGQAHGLSVMSGLEEGK